MVPQRSSQHNTSVLAFVLVAALGILSPWSLSAGELAIQITSVQPTSASSVSFSVQDFDHVTQEKLLLLSPLTSQSGQQHFNVTLDKGSFSRGKTNDFQFEIYVQKIGEPGAEHFRVSEAPIGVFTDFVASISITIRAPSILDTATLDRKSTRL